MAANFFQLPTPLATDPVNGVPASGAKLFFYENKTTTPKDTFTDQALTTPHANPVVADSGGYFPEIYLDGVYSWKLTTSADVEIDSGDDYRGPINLSTSGFVESVATLSDLQSEATTQYSDGDVLYMRGSSSVGDGKQGHVRLVSGDQSTNVSNDTDGETWVAPDSDPTGASGAWKRMDFQGEIKLNDNNEMQLDVQWPDVGNLYPSDIGSVSVSYRLDYDAANGSAASFQVGARLVDGSPGADTSVYGFKSDCITNAVSGTIGSPGHSNRVEHIAIEGRANIAPSVTGAMCQGGAFIARHWDATSSGKLLGSEFLIENRDQDLGDDRIDEVERHEGIRINSDGDHVAHAAITIAGSNSDGWHNGIAIKENRIKTRAFWYKSKALIVADGYAAFGADGLAGAKFRVFDADSPPVARLESDLTTGVVSSLRFAGDDDGGNQTDYARIEALAITATDTSEDGELQFQTVVGGSSTVQMDMRSGVRVGTPTGNFPGNGKLNAEDLLIDNVSCTTSSGTTGGSGSAGSGNQYIELNVGGTVYKVLHDGTV
jgi:hypothetical protein